MRITFFILVLALCVCCDVIKVSPSGQSPIGKAMLSVRAGDTIELAPGKYNEEIVIKSGVMLYSPSIFAAQIIGSGRESVVKLSGGSKISGVTISGGRNGVVSSNTGAMIENCHIHSNHGSGILAINRLPGITNCIISNNLNAGIQGTSIGSTEGELSHLTVAENRRNGIEIDGDQKILLKDCIFYRNGNRAVKVSNPDSVYMSNLLIYPEQKEFVNQDDLIARPVFSDKYYKLKDDSAGKNKASDGKDIGFVK
jgi:hypothetical protein